MLPKIKRITNHNYIIKYYVVLLIFICVSCVSKSEKIFIKIEGYKTNGITRESFFDNSSNQSVDIDFNSNLPIGTILDIKKGSIIGTTNKEFNDQHFSEDTFTLTDKHFKLSLPHSFVPAFLNITVYPDKQNENLRLKLNKYLRMDNQNYHVEYSFFYETEKRASGTIKQTIFPVRLIITTTSSSDLKDRPVKI